MNENNNLKNEKENNIDKTIDKNLDDNIDNNIDKNNAESIDNENNQNNNCDNQIMIENNSTLHTTNQTNASATNRSTEAQLTGKQQFRQVVLFTLFSAGAAAIQIGSFSLMNELCHFTYWPAYLISLLLSIIFNFSFNRKVTFHSNNNIPFAFGQVLLYYAIFTPVSLILGQYCTDIGCNEYLVLITTMLVNFVTEFLYQKFWVFRKSTNKPTDTTSG